MNSNIDSADAFTSGTVPLPGHDGDEIEAYVARPLAAEHRGGVVVIHHMPGYDAPTKEITRRFAAEGYNAVMPNLHFRDAPGADPDDAAAASRARGGVPDARLVGDVAGAAAHLRGLPNSNGKVGVIGFCSGGRQAFLAACSLDLDAAVDCYGAFVTAHSPDGFPITVRPVVGLAPGLSCPLLGLFGADDKFPSPGETAELSAVLAELGKEFEFHTYEGAGHAFFAVNRPAYQPEAAVAGWERVLDFFGRHLSDG
ncbi:dienelactone hydrolase family protein [Actinocorallia sp. API 0066]|uniref:dienelactone hydrolase family protein n=1 Tax=Actinocorallia sp. API 0066 TaxID=2896846 RepID=UPI001E347855|nr:dienelactone hydrolase family protein [Actinocorallia sp. API 0066]MCD0453690.1 dienelactone hydrolase family protein [Actinocorallia sp. API 0066]